MGLHTKAEHEFSDRAETSKRKADHEAYIATYQNGRYIDLARAALKKTLSHPGRSARNPP